MPRIPRPEIHGHRGARALRPENTLPGLACALAIGVDALEFDVTLTADGGLILAHDLTVDPATIRGPYAGSPWRSLTAAQIASLDAGWRTPPEPFADTFVPVPGTGVPTLADVARLITEAGAGHVTLAVELKADPSWPARDVRALTEGALHTLAAHGLTGRTRILAFNWRVLLVARASPRGPAGRPDRPADVGARIPVAGGPRSGSAWRGRLRGGRRVGRGRLALALGRDMRRGPHRHRASPRAEGGAVDGERPRPDGRA
jgi:Glycerophosphoryl diester phosphodiesterase family